MSELQDMVAETLQMERGTSKSETNLEHLERNDYIIHKQENKKRMLEDEKAKTLAEKELAETLAKKALSEKESAEHDKAIAVAEKNVIDNAIVRAKSEKISAERDRDKVMAEKKEFEMERDQTEAIIVQNLEKYESLKTKHSELVEKYNGLVGRYNNTLDDLQTWRSARDWQQYLIDYLDKVMYENDQTVKYAVDSLISYANNNDGRGGHQDFLHDDQSAAIKMVMTNFSPSDKSIWMKIAAWLLHLAKSIGHLGEQTVRLIAKDLTAVAEGRYDSRMEMVNDAIESDKLITNYLNHHVSVMLKASILDQVLTDAARICRESRDATALAEDTFIDDRNFLRWNDVLKTGMQVFMAGINGATSVAQTSGGGGTTSNMPWREKDEDYLHWAWRAMQYAHAKHYPGNKLRKSKGY